MRRRLRLTCVALLLLLLHGWLPPLAVSQQAKKSIPSFETLNLPQVGEQQDPEAAAGEPITQSDDAPPLPTLGSSTESTAESTKTTPASKIQTPQQKSAVPSFPASPSMGLGGMGGGFGGGFGPSIRYDAEFELQQGSSAGRLHVTATIAPGYHTYSTTQPEGGPLPTVITIVGSEAKIVGDFLPDRDPRIGKSPEYGDLSLEEYYGMVTWTAPVEFSSAATAESAELVVKVDALVCERSCLPINSEVIAKFTGFYQEVDKAETFRSDESPHAEWTASFKDSHVQPGESTILELTANTDPKYHIYEYVPGAEADSNRTLIVINRKSGLFCGTPVSSLEAQSVPGFEDLGITYYPGPVTWQIPIEVPADAREGDYPIEVHVGFLTCDDRSCDQPAGLIATGTLKVASETQAGPVALGFVASDFNDVAALPTLASWIDETSAAVAKSGGEAETFQALTMWHLFAALGGGFILNFMPCVLPVIGLKVMSFMNQSGNSHSKVVGLNLAYVAGIIAVMLVLALCTIIAKQLWGSAFGWGQQFTSLEFKVVLACLVFAMALSFLGVWEIPIPGFATSSKSGELMEKEGPLGAFLKGVLTTVLATPCSGPLLGSLFGLSLVLSDLNVLLLYTVVGIGMGLPFLALCLWPGFINFLPKPGAWMETLKQILAFPLLLTAVFFITSIEDEYRIATLILLIVVWFGCWLIGRVPTYSEGSQMTVAWTGAVISIALGAFVSFSYFGPFESEIDWIEYDEIQLSQLRAEGKTVMLDFTAKWCLNCQINTRVAIDKPEVARLVKENDVVPMLADWTSRSDEIRGKLEQLNSNSIPLLVIYPPEPDSEPILLRDVLTESQVLSALEEAGPSMEEARLTSAPIH